MRWLFLSLVASLLLTTACDPSPPAVPMRDGSVDGMVDDTDSDGDGISDTEEGSRDRTDTDMDGVPDFLDDDSDGDGIPDGAESGDGDLATPARDADRDGVPDFRDLDSDNNGIPDAEDSTMDSDGDGRPDFADEDDDNDRVNDAVELMFGGRDLDSDGDGLVDFKDPDSDDDTISDGDEREIDTDMDMLLDWVDLDTDSDGFSDSEEAGDTDLGTLPFDTDMDGIADFRDPDSDNDGVSDLDERAAGTSRVDGDSDMDGVSDLIELGAGTDPLDMTDSPRTRGDFVFVVPWMEPAEPLRDTLEFRTNIQFADVYFLFDKSGSMQGEIDGMRDAVEATLNELTCTDFGVACMTDVECAVGQVCSLATSTCSEDPATSTCVPSIWSGAGQYHDPYNNLRSLQADPAATRTTIDTIRAESSISKEDFFEAVTCLSSGTCGTSCTGPIGCPTYREAAVKLLVVFSDEDSDGGSRAAAAAAMNAANITFIGVWSNASNALRDDMEDLAQDTMSFRADGTTPLIFNGMDASVATAVTSAINEVVEGVPLRVTIEAADELEDDGDALPFIDYLEVNVSGVGACTAVTPTEDTDADTHDDAFPALRPGTGVCWDVVPIMNDIVEPSSSPLVFKARLTVRGDGSPLDSRLVFFLVPPVIEVPMGPM